MPRVAICGPSCYTVAAQFILGFQRIGWEVVRVGNDDPIPHADPNNFVATPRNGGFTTEYWVQPCGESEERERGDITWQEFHDEIGGQALDLVFVLEGSWSFIGPRVAPYEDTPVFFFAADPSRGPEKHVRDAVKSGAEFIFVQASHFVLAYQCPGSIARCIEFYRGIKPAAPKPPAPRFRAEYRFPFSYHDGIFQPDWNATKEFDIVFLGSWFPRGADGKFVTTYGEAWHRSRLLELLAQDREFKTLIAPIRPPQEWARVVHQGHILLHYNGGTFPYYTGFTIRPFEIMGSGEFLLMNDDLDNQTELRSEEHFGGFPTFYHPLHHHFDFFDYPVFKQTVRRWLEDDKGRERVRRAGYDHVRACHKPEDRARKIQTVLKELR